MAAGTAGHCRPDRATPRTAIRAAFGTFGEPFVDFAETGNDQAAAAASAAAAAVAASVATAVTAVTAATAVAAVGSPASAYPPTRGPPSSHRYRGYRGYRAGAQASDFHFHPRVPSSPFLLACTRAGWLAAWLAGRPKPYPCRCTGTGRPWPSWQCRELERLRLELGAELQPPARGPGSACASRVRDRCDGCDRQSLQCSLRAPRHEASRAVRSTAWSRGRDPHWTT